MSSVVFYQDMIADLPPTQQLILEVLTARKRLGHDYWTFTKTCGKSLMALEALGLVKFRAGAAGGYAAWLSDDAFEAMTIPNYVAPIDGGNQRGTA